MEKAVHESASSRVALISRSDFLEGFGGAVGGRRGEEGLEIDLGGIDVGRGGVLGREVESEEEENEESGG